MKVAQFIFFLFVSLPFLSAQIDTDDDGMPDDWEISHGFDINDPKDAFCDSDLDMILNLFEFQLGTNPRDGSSPIIENFSPGDGQNRFFEILNKSAQNPILLRMATGEYNLSYVGPTNSNYKIMIQGGWNEDFTQYNPIEFPTIIRENDDPVFIIALNSFTVGSFAFEFEVALILDGIQFTDNSLNLGSGFLTFFGAGENGYLSLHNCCFYNMPYYIIQFLPRGNSKNQQFYIINSVIANNVENETIFCNMDDNAKAKIRIINSTITSNGSSGNVGIDIGSYSPTTILDIKITNSIIWEENVPDFKSLEVSPHEGEVELNVIASNLSRSCTNINSIEVITNHPLNINPQFEDNSLPYITLDAASPLKESGIDIGLPFDGAAPDIGFNAKFLIPLSTSTLVQFATCGNADGEIIIGEGQDLLIENVTASIDGVNYQDSLIFRDLRSGFYTVYIKVRGCPPFTKDVSLVMDFQLASSDFMIEPTGCDEKVGRLYSIATDPPTNVNYSIDSLSFTDVADFGGLPAGPVTLFIKDSLDCIHIKNFVIPGESAPNIDAVMTENTTCGQDNGAVEIVGSGGTGNLEYAINAASPSSNNYFSDLPAANYLAFLTDENGCKDSLAFTIESSGAVLIQDTIVMPATCALENGTIEVVLEGSISNTQFAIDGQAYQDEPIFSGLGAGSYEVFVKGEFCNDTTTATIPTAGLPQLSIDDRLDTSCGFDNGSISVSAALGSGSYVYSHGNISNTNGEFSNLSPNNYTISVTDGNDCRDSLTIEILSSSGISVSDNIITDANCSVQNGSITINATSPNGGLQYTLNEEPLTSENTFSGLAAGDYFIRIEDQLGCESLLGFRLDQVLSPVITNLSSVQENCGNEDAVIEIEASSRSSALKYSLDGTAFFDNGVFTDLKKGQYTCYVVDDYDCIVSASVNVDGTLPISLLDVVGLPVDCDAQIGQIEFTIEKGNDNEELNIYNTDGLEVDIDSLVSGDYTLEVVDGALCSDEAPFTISPSNCNIYIPNIFNPNLPAPNNRLSIHVDALNFATLKEMKIYDYWGNIVYEIQDIELANFEDWWDGSSAGQKLAAGVYTYQFILESFNGSENKVYGTITLIR